MRQVSVRLVSGLVAVSLVVFLVVKGYTEWQKTTTATAVCWFYAQDWQQHGRHIELDVDNERLRDPIFDGHYIINLGQEFGHQYQLRMDQAGSGNYLLTTSLPRFIWSDNLQNLTMASREEIAFVSRGNSHFMFPFDHGKFHETLTFEPPIDIKAVELKNLVPGFYMPCERATVHMTMGSAEISFVLKRNPLIVYTAVLLLMVAALFAVLITLFVEDGPLPGALASYFFAVWNIRWLFGLTAEGFPTLFDIGIIVLVSLIPLLLFLRVLGLPRALSPVGRYARNLVRGLEGRELLLSTPIDG